MLGLNHRGLHVSSGTQYVILKSQLMYYKVFRYDSDKNLCFISKTNQTPNVFSNQNEATRVHLIRTWSGHLLFFFAQNIFIVLHKAHQNGTQGSFVCVDSVLDL